MTTNKAKNPTTNLNFTSKRLWFEFNIDIRDIPSSQIYTLLALLRNILRIRALNYIHEPTNKQTVLKGKTKNGR